LYINVLASSSLMASQICFPLWNHNFLKHNYAPTFSSPRTLFSISLPKASLSSSTQQHHPKRICNDPHKDALVSHCLSKRKLGLSILAVFSSSGLLPNMTKAIFAGELELERYTDPMEGFTLLRPSSWTKVPTNTILSLHYLPYLSIYLYSIQTDPLSVLLVE
jgi:hypothetical protein